MSSMLFRTNGACYLLLVWEEYRLACNETKIIIVEGLADKIQLEKVVQPSIDIICTHGTFGIEKFDMMLEKHDLDNREVYIFVDEDDAGKKLRKQLRAELSHAIDLCIHPEYVEVESAPLSHLAHILQEQGIAIKQNILF